MRRQQLHRVSELADFTPPVMRTAADFQRHDAGCLLRQELQKPAACARLAKYRVAVGIGTVQGETGFGGVDTDYRTICHVDSLRWRFERV